MPGGKIDVYLDFGKLHVPTLAQLLPTAKGKRLIAFTFCFRRTASLFSYVCFTDLEANKQKLAANGVTIE